VWVICGKKEIAAFAHGFAAKGPVIPPESTIEAE
jgi:hypothetical protein